MIVRSLKLRWMAFPLAYYAANAVWQGYMSLFYRHLGFAEGRIGLISAVTAFCALLVQPLWGKLGDGSSKTKRLLSLLALLSAAAILPALLKGDFYWQLMFAALFYVFYCALLPMGDAILLDALNREKLPFGPYRLAGAVSFALSGAVFGWILNRSGAKSVVPASAALLLLAAVTAWFLPEKERKPRQKRDFRSLLKNRELMCMLAFMVPVQMTVGFFYTFFAPYFFTLPGANSTLLGIGYALATLGEIPYLLLSDKIYDKFGAAKPMCVSALVLAAKWLLTGFSKNAYLAAAGQLLHGGGFIVMTVSMAKYISGHADGNLRTSGQMLLSMVSYGIARVAGNLGGGLLAEKIGGSSVFFICAGICIASVCIFAPKAFRRQN